ncbi:hypothetical protein POUND7_003859 [Theobroma cacao]
MQEYYIKMETAIIPVTPNMPVTPITPTDNSEPLNSEVQPNKRRRKKSIVWDHFTVETVGDGCIRACCNQCKKSFAYITGSKLAGTSHLKRHIALGICPVSRQRNQQTPDSKAGNATEEPRKRYRATPGFANNLFNQERCNHEVAKMIIMHEYPLHIVEHPGFIGFVRTLQPQFNTMSFNTIQGDCVAMYLKEKQSLINFISEIPGRVSLTLDLWTSNQTVGYVFITGQFIDTEWNLHCCLLNVVMVPSPDSDSALQQAVVSSLCDWHLENRLFALTLDQSFSNENINGNLRALFSVRNPYMFHGQLLVGNCFARVVSILAQEVLWAVGETVKKVRESVKFVKTSDTHEETFFHLREQLKVPSTKDIFIDDQTKWNTTYDMLVAACELKQVFLCLETSIPDYKIAPSIDDWKQVEIICNYLKLFFDAVSILTGPAYPTASAFYHEVSKVQLELSHAAMSNDPFVSNLTKPLKEKFDRYWSDCFLVLAIAVVMDPRFKMKLVEFSFSRIYGEDAGMWIKIVDDGIHELYLEYIAQALPPPETFMEEGNGGITPEGNGSITPEGNGGITPEGNGGIIPKTEPPEEVYCQEVSHEDVAHQEVSHEDIAHQEVSHQEAAHQEISHQEVAHQEINHQELAHQEISDPEVPSQDPLISIGDGLSDFEDVKPDDYTFPFLLKGFDRDVGLSCGKKLHGHAVKFGFGSNVFVQNALIHMYSLCGQMEMARAVFDVSCKRDVITWNVIITGYNRMKQYDETNKLFDEMERNGMVPTSVTLVSLLSACSKLKDLEVGKRVHKYIQKCKVESNLTLENALMDMYAACGEMDVAVRIFDRMKTKDVISWTTIVSGFVNKGEIDLARDYFDRMPERDYVSWTAMIDGYLRVNCFKEALVLFREMQALNIRPDEFTMVSILTACAQLGALQIGEWIKTYIERNKVKNDVFVGNALIDMYFKCGSIEKAQRVFNGMPWRDKFTWTAMIFGLAINGHGEEALGMFSEMLRASIKPDEVTYIGVLCACTHAGMVDEGRKFFASMTTEHGVQPNVAHYGCMVDLLGRAGHLQEACEVIKNMPMKPNSIVWGALLGGCRLHKDVEIAEMAAKQILESDPDNGAVYVMLCNIYASCKRWDSLHDLRESMMHRGIKKTPGCSLIEMNGVVHEFVAGDQSHPQSKEIYLKLDKVMRDLEVAGYSPDTSEVFLDIGEEDKQSTLCWHSEKLALAFGLICSRPGVTIRIVKNLRMCVDCHRVAKLVSKLYDREVIVRDRTRFHHFRHGSCSCKDYW